MLLDLIISVTFGEGHFICESQLGIFFFVFPSFKLGNICPAPQHSALYCLMLVICTQKIKPIAAHSYITVMVTGQHEECDVEHSITSN
jgi:hypothetical protein